jgi:hypothetical protein
MFILIYIYSIVVYSNIIYSIYNIQNKNFKFQCFKIFEKN